MKIRSALALVVGLAACGVGRTEPLGMGAANAPDGDGGDTTPIPEAPVQPTVPDDDRGCVEIVLPNDGIILDCTSRCATLDHDDCRVDPHCRAELYDDVKPSCEPNPGIRFFSCASVDLHAGRRDQPCAGLDYEHCIARNDCSALHDPLWGRSTSCTPQALNDFLECVDEAPLDR